MVKKSQRKRLASASVLVAATALIAACSSAASSGSSATGSASPAGTSSAGASSSGSAASDAGSTPAGLLTTAPTQIHQTTPLTEKPPTGKSVVIVGQNLPLESYEVQHMVDLAKDFGWTAKTYLYGGTVTTAAAFQQAIDAKPDYIVLAGAETDTVKTQMAAAKSAGIPVVGFQNFPQVSDISGGYYDLAWDLSSWYYQITDWIIKKSDGKAQLVNITLPQYPQYAKVNAALKPYIQKNCPNCSYNELDLTIDDLTGGKVPSTVTSYLQSHPNVNYLVFPGGDFMPGVEQALKAVGLLSKVTITGVAPNQAQLQEIAGGANEAWSSYATMGSAYLVWDFLARLSTGVKITQAMLNEPAFQSSAAPIWVVDSPEQAKLIENDPFGWTGPAGMDAQYKKLWLVS
jgi:ribose transport system substrate-binding protein